MEALIEHSVRIMFTRRANIWTCYLPEMSSAKEELYLASIPFTWVRKKLKGWASLYFLRTTFSSTDDPCSPHFCFLDDGLWSRLSSEMETKLLYKFLKNKNFLSLLQRRWQTIMSLVWHNSHYQDTHIAADGKWFYLSRNCLFMTSSKVHKMGSS